MGSNPIRATVFGEFMEIVCLYSECNNTFKSRSKGGGRYKKYCSSDCFRKAKPKKVKVVCQRETCDVEFTDYESSKRKYCSRSCSVSVNNKITKVKVSNCTRCSGEIHPSRIYCDPCWSTRSSWVIEDYVSAWKSGDTSKVCGKSGELTSTAKRRLIEMSEFKCSRCGWSEINPILGRPILTIDHIDGNWLNNSYENLAVLCYNCHTLTPTFGALNKGSISGSRANPESRKRK